MFLRIYDNRTAKKFGEGGTNNPWEGGTKNFLDGGDRPLWGGNHFMGYGPPHPPMLGTPVEYPWIVPGLSLDIQIDIIWHLF